MLPVERIIGEEGIRVSDGKVLLAMRLPWYRSLPFSTVEFVSLSIDGAAVPLDHASIEYDGESWSLAENGEKVDSFWFVRESAFLNIPDLAVNAGEEHEVALTINVNPPYIPGMKRANSQVQSLQVQS